VTLAGPLRELRGAIPGQQNGDPEGSPSNPHSAYSRGGTRTPDPLINSQLLYRLSYSGKTLRRGARRGGKVAIREMGGKRVLGLGSEWGRVPRSLAVLGMTEPGGRDRDPSRRSG
jgi:hypothetical protein